MVAAIKQTVTVLPGGRIEVRSPQLRPGTQAEVIVLVDDGVSDGAPAKPPMQALEDLQRGMRLDARQAQESIAQTRSERAAFGGRS